MYQYPYGNAQQLNLDWILSKLQELEAGSGGGADLEEVANALVSASFDAGVSYRRYDYCFYNGKLYRALNDTSGAFNPADWLEVVIGDDIPVLTRLLNAVDTSLTSLQNTVNDLDSDDVDNASTVTGTTVTDALETLATALGDLDSDDVDNASLVVSGDTVTEALDELAGAITTEATARGNADTVIEQGLAIIVNGDTCSVAVPAGGYAYIKNNTHGLAEGLYKNKTSGAFPTSGGTANSTVFEAITTGGLNDVVSSQQLTVIDYSGTLSDTLYDGYYYTSIESTIPVSRMLSVYITGTYQNHLAFCQMIGNYIRVWGNTPSISVAVRAVYKS